MILEHHPKHGFTLIELLIVIAIIIFLAKLIIPRYSAFYAKARQTEVMLNLSNLYAAQQAYYIQHGRFTTNLKTVEWQPKGYTGNPETTQHAYTYGSIGIDHNGQEGVTFYTGSSQTPATLLTGSQLTAENFVFKAALRTESTTEVWRIDHTGEIKREQ
ncbi:MAG: type pilus assembly protein PilA [Candidatus Dependentiae bacterium]|nr:type pilus assembly protein PilA [Candidatus Dependentiae bacterium]